MSLPYVICANGLVCQSDFNFASCRLVGANKVLETALYLAWAQIATEPESLNSALCEVQATQLDPCPFPPVTADAGFWGTLLLTLVFLLYVSGV